MMVSGGICAILHGTAQPAMLIVFGIMTDAFIQYDIEKQELNDPNKVCMNNTIVWINNSHHQNVSNASISCGWVSTKYFQFYQIALAQFFGSLSGGLSKSANNLVYFWQIIILLNWVLDLQPLWLEKLMYLKTKASDHIPPHLGFKQILTLLQRQEILLLT